jgi:hypothetical protein
MTQEVAGEVPGESVDERVEVPDELAPDPDLRAARNELRALSAILREAVAADERAAGDEPAADIDDEVTR